MECKLILSSFQCLEYVPVVTVVFKIFKSEENPKNASLLRSENTDEEMINQKLTRVVKGISKCFAVSFEIEVVFQLYH